MTASQNAIFRKNSPSPAQGRMFLCRFGVCALVLLSTLAVGSAFAPALAQSNNLDSRVKRLENDVDTLNRAVYKGEPPPPIAQDANGGVAAMQGRVDQLENDVRNLTGKVEQQSYDLQQLQQRVQALSDDSQMRFDNLEKQGRSASQNAPMQAAPIPGDLPQEGTAPMDAQQPPQPMVPAGTTSGNTGMGGGLSDADRAAEPVASNAASGDVQTSAPAPQGTTDTTKPLGGGSVVTPSGAPAASDAATLYEQGFAEIKKNDNAAAEKTFSDFIKKYPNHALTPNAYYWLGETYYVRKDYDKATRTFAESYKKFPKGPKAPDNLLKLGLSLAAKGQKDNACVALGQLKKEYPKGAADVLKKGEDERAKLGCK